MWTQLLRERGNRLFDIDISAIHLLGPEDVWELLKNVFPNHGDHGLGLLGCFLRAVATRFRVCVRTGSSLRDLNRWVQFSQR